MEENKNEKKSVEAEVVNENTSKTTNSAVEFIKAKKGIIGILILAIIIICVVIDIVVVTPKEVVKDLVKSIDSGKLKKAIDCVDMAGAYVFSELDEDDIDDFWSEYKDFKDTDEYEDMMEEMEEELDDNDYLDEFEEMMDEYDVSFKVKKIKKVKKEASHLYKVTAKLEISYEDYDMSGNVDFYVMKDGTKSYVVYMDSDDSGIGLDSLLSSSIY